VLSKEGVNLIVIKFATIVTLNGEDGEVKLGSSISMKGGESGIDIRFFVKGKGPKVMCIIIHNNKIISKTRSARNRRCPQVTMQ
jgi:hypothetical protein